MNSQNLDSDANYTKVLNIQTRVWTTPLQHPNMVGAESVEASLGRGELLKGKHCNQERSCPIVLGLGNEGIGQVLSETIGQFMAVKTLAKSH